MNKTIIAALIAYFTAHTSFDIVETVDNGFGFTTVTLAPLHVQDEQYRYVTVELSPTRIVFDSDFYSCGDFVGRERHIMANTLDDVKLYIINHKAFLLRNSDY